ncbi:hypothetical protein [Veillonella magna]|uniref:Uncharacterized protein n=1 Tax=Veillonella magna TaxID=464322 RepID=A0ABS2GG31_9FIRM|nr:hypothetical protein [Veillonella magna]MBM6824815.1 hypothetical protein [Veillonella magna]MBM6913106.1 hypothetical protein [Veillonella magna]
MKIEFDGTLRKVSKEMSEFLKELGYQVHTAKEWEKLELESGESVEDVPLKKEEPAEVKHQEKASEPARETVRKEDVASVPTAPENPEEKVEEIPAVPEEAPEQDPTPAPVQEKKKLPTMKELLPKLQTWYKASPANTIKLNQWVKAKALTSLSGLSDEYALELAKLMEEA